MQLIPLEDELAPYEKTIKEVGIQAIWLIGEQLQKAKEKIVEITEDKRAPGFIQWAQNKFGFKKTAVSLYIKAFQEEIENPKLIWGNEKSVQLTEPIITDSDSCTISDLYSLIEQGKTFGTIYADPPWAYDNQASENATSRHYENMSIEEISSLPIKKLTNDKAHLHLWTTNNFVFECPEIIEAWGFEYKSILVWIKNGLGMGNYWRVTHEFLVTSVKGSQTFLEHNHKSWIELRRGRHSSKPEEIVDKIEKVSPSPYLELFGRRERKNWTVWGNQIPKQAFLKM